ncbi:CASP-like protein 1F1 [Bienertia sinuspersici]
MVHFSSHFHYYPLIFKNFTFSLNTNFLLLYIHSLTYTLFSASTLQQTNTPFSPSSPIIPENIHQFLTQFSIKMQSYREDGKQEDNNALKIKGQKMVELVQIVLRALALATSIAATCILFTSKQTTLVFGIEMDAKYSYSSAYKFYGIATTIASVCSFLSLGLTLILQQNASSKANYHLLFFMHDLVIMSVILSGCAAATAIGYVGQYGYDHAGWMPICDHFKIFCHKITASVILAYFSLIFFFLLTILSAIKTSNLNFLPTQIRNSS